MTDKETLLTYRFREAEETLCDAEKMLREGLSPRSVINRAYYSMFYSLLALFISEGINAKTSKHSGVIAIFDKEFVHSGKIDRRYSRMLHRMFDTRQECDYKELVEITTEDAAESVTLATEFVQSLKSFMEKQNKE